jgi:hypothetical protein
MALLHTGKFISVRSFTSRTPASMIRPAGAARLEAGGQQVAEVAVGALSAVTAATTTSPGWICSAATCIIQLSPGCSSTVTAVPQTFAPVCRWGACRASSGRRGPWPRGWWLRRSGGSFVGAGDVAFDDA